MPLGLYPNRTYEESSVKLKPGDSIILYSDGVTEQQGANSQHFGIERLFHVLNKSASLKPEKVIDEVNSNLDLFKGELKQTDDITLMVIKYKNKNKA
jgi:sigma-B regulation protein RsbU (phosphoserine phosphatase)